MSLVLSLFPAGSAAPVPPCELSESEQKMEARGCEWGSKENTVNLPGNERWWSQELPRFLVSDTSVDPGKRKRSFWTSFRDRRTCGPLVLDDVGKLESNAVAAVQVV